MIKKYLKLFFIPILAIVFIRSVIIFGQAHNEEKVGAPVQELKISELINTKSPKEKVQIKAFEIAKRHKSDLIGEFIRDGYTVQITDISYVESDNTPLVELYARAYKGGKQLGFGKDGSIDLERFQFYNPPVMVPDPNGTYIQSKTKIDGTSYVDKFREDPAEAIRLSLIAAIKSSGKENTNIISGKIGHTILTARPVAGANSPVDGNVLYQGTGGASFATVHDATDGTAADTNTANINAFLAASNFAGDYDISRGVTCHDTSAIGASGTINSAEAAVRITDGRNESTNATWNIYSVTLGATNTITTADYNDFGTTGWSTAKSIVDHPASAQFFDFDFNATGLAAISKTGVTCVGWRETAKDVGNTAPGAGNANRQAADMADTAGTVQDPYMIIDYTAGAAGGATNRRRLIEE